MIVSKDIAVVGAGAAGLAAARSFINAGHKVIVFEKTNAIGGTWHYQTETGDSIHASMYKGIPSFPGHHEVLKYLEEYCVFNDLYKHIQFNSKIDQISCMNPMDSNSSWKIQIHNIISNQKETKQFDGVVVCNGHFSRPHIPKICGQENFKGSFLHSHNYRTPEMFKDMTVLIVGRGPSGQDISLDLNDIASKVYISYSKPISSIEEFPTSISDTRIHKPLIKSIALDGSIVFEDKSKIQVDSIIYCTGYHHDMEIFNLPKNKSVNTNEQDKDVPNYNSEPLYLRTFCIPTPTLSFVGIPYTTIPFRCFEFQADCISKFLSGTLKLPSKEDMLEIFYDEINELHKQNIPLHTFHSLANEKQPQFFKKLAKLTGREYPKYIQEMYEDASYLRSRIPYHYRDTTYTSFKSKKGDMEWERQIKIDGKLYTANSISNNGP